MLDKHQILLQTFFKKLYIFYPQVKLVDVEKVEWLNRRSYSAIGLFLGNREGRVLLRTDNGLEDWFELLEECTLNSKQRRQALRLTQGPRSRASLAAPPSAHASLYTNHLGLGGTYSSAIEDWLLARNKSINSSNHFILSDSVPDLSAMNDNGGMMTTNSTPKRVPSRNGNINGYPNGGSPNCYSPSSRIIKNKNYDNILIEDDEEVQLRRGRCDNNENKDQNWMYRKPLGPHDQRHSCKIIEI